MSEHWDAQATTLEAARNAVWSEPDWDLGVIYCMNAIRRGLDFENAQEVLEIGCGVGRIMHPLAKRYPNAHFHGQDISPAMLNHAKVNAPPNVTWWLDCLPEVDLDIVYSMLVFQHLPADRVQSYFREISKRLRDGGRLRFQFVEGSYAVDHDHRHRLEDIRAWLEEAGMDVIAIDSGLGYAEWTWVTAVKL